MVLQQRQEAETPPPFPFLLLCSWSQELLFYWGTKPSSILSCVTQCNCCSSDSTSLLSSSEQPQYDNRPTTVVERHYTQRNNLWLYRPVHSIIWNVSWHRPQFIFFDFHISEQVFYMIAFCVYVPNCSLRLSNSVYDYKSGAFFTRNWRGIDFREVDINRLKSSS